jgi:hypothetical protein
MRLWSIHPKYLDSRGLVALWRESLLAKSVLEGKTSGYTNHPQLERFKKLKEPLVGINIYLETVFNEAKSRGYNFDKSKFKKYQTEIKIEVSDKQIQYEFEHLKKKLEIRDMEKYTEIVNIEDIEVNPIFKKYKGEIERWEKI